MKLTTLLAAAAVFASTALISAEAPNMTTPEVSSDSVARVCPDWPFCRDVEFAQQQLDSQKQLQQVIVRSAV